MGLFHDDDIDDDFSFNKKSSFYSYNYNYNYNDNNDDYEYEERRRRRRKNPKRQIALFVIIIGILAIYQVLTNKPVEKDPVLVDPNTVTEQQKLDGFTTERIYKHYTELIDKYFPNNKSDFIGWTIQYKKNEEWNQISYTDINGESTSGNYYGVCDYGAKVIYLNDDFFPRYDSHDDVILHEMIHIVTQGEGHQGRFLKEIKRISKASGIPVNVLYGYNGYGSVE